MTGKTVTATGFKTHTGRYLDDAAKTPVFITKYGRPTRVLLDIDEYERLRRYDTRRTYAPHELPDAVKEELEKGYQGRKTPELDPLLK